MRKINKRKLRTDQTVFSFACPCGSCTISNGCNCRQNNVYSASWTVVQTQYMNRQNGGSFVGGAG